MSALAVGEKILEALRRPFRLHGHELYVSVSGLKRTFPLPASVQRCTVGGARLDDGVLHVRFVAPAPAQPPRQASA